VEDRRWRIKDSKPGEVVIYTDEGDTITLKRNNIIEVATKGDVIVKAGRAVSVEAEAAVAVKAGTTVAITADAAITLTAPTILLNGNLSASSGGSAVFNAGKFVVNADVVSLNEGCE